MSNPDNVVSFGGSLTAEKSYEDIKEDNIQRRILLRKLQPRIKKLITVHMSKIMQGMFDTADDALFKMAENAVDGVDKNLYMDSMRVIRLQKKSMEETFFNEVGCYFDCFEKNLDVEKKEVNWHEINVDSLGLVSEADLEIDLATDNLIQKIRNLYAFDLNALDKRLTYLINNKNIETSLAPFGADVIVRSFVKASEGVQLTLEIQLIVLKLFDLHCIHNLADLYNSINNLFIEENVLPIIKQEFARQPGGVPIPGVEPGNAAEPMTEMMNNLMAQSAPGQNQTGVNPMNSAMTNAPMWAQLQQLMNSQRQTGGLASIGMPMQGNEGTNLLAGQIDRPASPLVGMGGRGLSIPTQDVVSALTNIQSMSFDEVPDSGAYAVGNFLRVQLEQSNVNVEDDKPLNPVDNDLIDIVSLIFEYILEDPNLPATAKASIARLQIPMIKVAMLDKEFFSANGHPARHLLNLLASTAVGIDDGEGLEHPVLNKINELVEKILEHFVDDIGIFSELIEQLNEFINEHQANEITACNDLGRTQHEKEELALARAWVKETLSQHLIGRALPKPVVEIILGAWKDVMLETYLQQGEHSQLWKTQIRFIDVLCWSIEPKTHNLDRKKLGMIIQQLVVTLRNGFNLIDMPVEELESILNTLEPYHLASVHGLDLSQCIMIKANSEDDEQTVQEEDGDETNNSLADERSDNALDDDKVIVEEIILEDWEPAKDLDQVEDEYLELARHLEMGKWVEFKNEKGDTRRAKLAWKSDLLGEFTFLNWKFDVVADKSLHELAEDLRQGHARVVNDVPLMDRALSAVVSSLIPKTG